MDNVSFSTAMTMLGIALATPVTGLQAAELTVLAGGSMTAVMKDLGPKFEQATGNRLTIKFAGTPELIKLATSGEPFDLGIVPQEVFKDASARARFAPGPILNIAHVGYGVAVKAGTPKPDVSSPEALKQTLLAARSVTFYPESAAGAFVIRTFEKLGIGDAMKAKIIPQSSPAHIPAAVAKGEAELGVFLINILSAPGVELAGPFPAGLQQDLVFAGAVAADSKNADAAQALIDYLRTPEAVTAIKAKGMTPG